MEDVTKAITTEPEKIGASDKTVAVIIPTLNEETTIYDVVKGFVDTRIDSVELRLIVVDGGSTDQTAELAKKAGAQVLRQKGKGKGAAMKGVAYSSNADIFVFIDGDGTYLPSELEFLLQPILEDQADMVVGSRLNGKMEKGAITTLNVFGNKLFNLMTNLSMKMHLTDILSGYRAIRAEAFRELVLFSDGFEIEAEITIESIARKFRIVEVPITYKNRIKERTKLSPLKDGSRIFNTLFFIVMNARPLFFFGIIASVFYAVGSYPASLVLYEKITTGDVVHLASVILSAMLFVLGTLVLISGLLAELVVRSRRRIEHVLGRYINR
jgi:dolichol-phosphate mannosyltransferase